jgi:hypothetical protein
MEEKKQSNINLVKSLCDLEASIKKSDENDAIRLGHTWRIQLYNVTPDINVVLHSQQLDRQLYKNLHFIQGHTDLHKTIKKLFYIY